MYTSIDEIKAANKAVGQKWFEPDTMRFFDSRVLDKIIAGRYFVTSERPPGGEAEGARLIRGVSACWVACLGGGECYAHPLSYWPSTRDVPAMDLDEGGHHGPQGNHSAHVRQDGGSAEWQR